MILKGYKVNSPYKYENEKSPNEILDFKKLNVFVGSNNSGKSRFMRQLFLSDLKNKFTIEDREYYLKLKKIYDDLHTAYQSDIFSMADLKKLLEEYKYFNDFINRYFIFLESLIATANTTNGFRSISGSNINDVQLAKTVLAHIKDNDLIFDVNNRIFNDFKYIYIPMLRGLRNYSGHKDIYLDKTFFDYFVEDKSQNYIDKLVKNKKEIFSGLSVYERVKNMLLGNKEERKIISKYQDFLKENFFENNKELTLIPKPNEELLNVDIGNHKDRAIYDVGDGIQSMIINTFPAFENQNEKTILFIEEPEMTMHPSMQRVLLETLLKFPELQIFVTTHSNHFLDLVYDYQDEVSIYSFEEDNLKNNNSGSIDESSFIISNITNNSKILDILGIRNSSVFLANCVIWVEGVTDRMLLRKLFEIFGLDKKYKEDYDYSISEFGGGNIDNFDFSVNEELSDSEKVNVYAGLSKNNFLLLDNDTKTKKEDTKKEKRDYLKQLLGEENVFDEYPEIENLISYRVWVEILPELLKNSKKIEIKEGYDKKEKEFNGLVGTKDIGVIMRKIFIKSKDEKNKHKDFNKKDITCLGFRKKVIMEKVLEKVKSKEDFTPLAQTLYDKLDSFIFGIKNKKTD